MARRLCQFLLALALVYCAGLGAWAFFRYSGERPDVLTMAQEMNAWAVGLVAPKGAPGGREAPAPRPTPLPPPPAPPPAVEVSVPVPAPPMTPVERVREELLPRAEEEVRALSDRSVRDFEIRRTQARTTLVEARDILGPLIDEGTATPEVHRLYERVSALLIAVDKR